MVVTPHLRSLIDPVDPIRPDPIRPDPIRRQFLPSPEEGADGPGESPDPLEEGRVEAVPHLLHRYPDRVLLLATDRCAAHCRFCFRRETTGRRGWAIGDRGLARAAAYVASRAEIMEVIISGGDPLMLPRSRLWAVLSAFAPASLGREVALRLHTRVPMAWPRRVTAHLAEGLASLGRPRVVLHLNHPRELAPECLEAVGRLQRAGLEMLSQGVLLKGVNDDPQTLAELWGRQGRAGIRPHYLFQPDLARGTAHFRVDLERALGIYRRARELHGPGSGSAERPLGGGVPGFALDLPGGGGKVLLEECRLRRESGGFYRIEAPGGAWALYPAGEGCGARGTEAIRTPAPA